MKTLTFDDEVQIKQWIDAAIEPMVQSLAIGVRKGNTCVSIDYESVSPVQDTVFSKVSCLTPSQSQANDQNLPLPKLPDLPGSLMNRMTDTEKNVWAGAVTQYQRALTIAIRGKP